MIERIKVNGTIFTLRTEGESMRATKGKRSAMFDAVDAEPIRPSMALGGALDVDSARKAIVKRLQVLSVRAPVEAAAVPSLTFDEAIAFAATNNARATELENEARELREQGRDLVRRALA